MLKIRAIKIEVHTTNGQFGGNYEFSNGLNIIKGNNTAGKSTLFQAILYGLGMEELLGAKNEKTMQSALRDSVEFPKGGTLYPIIESQIFLEIENKEIITIQRAIKSSKSSKLLRVHKGGILTNKNLSVEFVDTWIHDKGGASNETRGFHSILEKFLEWELPEVYYSQGNLNKLYIQTIFPAFIIEQKSGWSDFLATIPYFGLRNAESRVVEFLLKLDLFENERKRQFVKEQKSSLATRWKFQFDELLSIAKRGSIEISGISNQPEIFTTTTPVNLFAFKEGNRILLSDLLEDWRTELKRIEFVPFTQTSQTIIDNTNQRLRSKQNYLDEMTIKWELLNQRLSVEKGKVEQYRYQLKEIQEELRHNKDVEKIYKLGGSINLNTADQICPACNQDIKDSLFMPEVHLNPMNIKDNISYIEAQEKMILAYLNIEQINASSDEKKATSLFNELTEIRKEIRDMKKDLISDERIPSVAQIEQRIQLKNKIQLYYTLIDGIDEKREVFEVLSREWQRILTDEKNLSKEFLTAFDYEKINMLESYFKSFLQKFEYTSKGREAISISKVSDKQFLLPVVESEGLKYNIRFDSSGSDLIRSLWSYYCALYKVSQKKETNHPKLLMFDEPAQQEVANSSFNDLLKELEGYTDGQVLIFASFHQSDSDYDEMVKGLKYFNLITIEDRSVMPIK